MFPDITRTGVGTKDGSAMIFGAISRVNGLTVQNLLNTRRNKQLLCDEFLIFGTCGLIDNFIKTAIVYFHFRLILFLFIFYDTSSFLHLSVMHLQQKQYNSEGNKT